MTLVLWGTPAALDVELDAVVSGILGRFAQGTEESRIKPGYSRNLVIEDRRAVGGSASRCSAGKTSMCGMAVQDEDASNW